MDQFYAALWTYFAPPLTGFSGQVQNSDNSGVPDVTVAHSVPHFSRSDNSRKIALSSSDSGARVASVTRRPSGMARATSASPSSVSRHSNRRWFSGDIRDLGRARAGRQCGSSTSPTRTGQGADQVDESGVPGVRPRCRGGAHHWFDDKVYHVDIGYIDDLDSAASELTVNYNGLSIT